MNNTNENIRYYRKLVGMTRKDLAEGICDTSTLFRIEKGEQIPRLDILSGICQRLKVPIDYIVSNISHMDLNEIEKYKRLCREFTYNKDYESLSLIIEEFESFANQYINQPEFPIVKRFVNWHKAVYLHEKQKDLLAALNLIKSIYNNQLRTELDIGICNSLGMIQMDLNGTTYATNYFLRAYNAINSLPILTDKTLMPRVGYNLAYCYYYQWEMEKAISIIYKVLEQLETHHLSFMLGKTKHMLGKIYQRQKDYIAAEEFLTQSLYLFHIESKFNYYNQAKQDLTDLKKLISNSEMKE